MEKNIASLSGHLIVCGSGGTALYTAAELLAVERQVVIICDHPERWDHVRKELPEVPIVLGDPATDEILEAAGIKRAAGMVACTERERQGEPGRYAERATTQWFAANRSQGDGRRRQRQDPTRRS